MKDLEIDSCYNLKYVHVTIYMMLTLMYATLRRSFRVLMLINVWTKLCNIFQVFIINGHIQWVVIMVHASVFSDESS